MKVKFIETEGDFLQATIQIQDTKMNIMDNFAGNLINKNEIVDLEIVTGIENDKQDWDYIFSSNPNKEKNYFMKEAGNIQLLEK